MPLSPAECIKFRMDNDRSDELLLLPIMEFLYQAVLNPAKLGTTLGLGGPYVPDTNEVLIAKQEIKAPGTWERAITDAAFLNIKTLLPNADTAQQAIAGLSDGTMHGDVFAAMQVFSPLLSAVLAEDD